jgi:hypothetical protein
MLCIPRSNEGNMLFNEIESVLPRQGSSGRYLSKSFASLISYFSGAGESRLFMKPK